MGSHSIAENVDVLIVGSGSAGLCAATWLTKCGIRCKILERNSGPMQLGQADGVQCRTVEVFESFGMAEELLRSAYHVLEVVFWSANNAEGKLARIGRTADTMKGLSHQPHVILNQAYVNGFLLDAMKRFNGQVVDYNCAVKSVEVRSLENGNHMVNENGVGHEDYPVTVVSERGGEEKIYKAKYVLGCDGAHSSVRRSLGYKMIGDSTDAVWGVMDIYPRTNFPDIRKKATLHSNAGNLLLIPREGNRLVRCYIELPHGTNPKSVKLEHLHEAAQNIFHPFTLDIADTFWWSAYSIGQRLVDHFHKDNRVFLTGDACHTHSPKAGQGMNVSLQDGYNIGWKLAAVLKGRASPKLLETYDLERSKVASDLINFDREFIKLFQLKSSGDSSHSPEYFAEQFIKSGQYTAGLTSKYEDSYITSSVRSRQTLATGVPIGMRFATAQVVRFCDAKAMQLVKALPADGRWRIVVFGGDFENSCCVERVNKLAEYLASGKGPAHRYTLPNEDPDSFIEPILVLHGERVKIEQSQIPDYFQPVNSQWKMKDLLKTFFDDESYNSGHGHAYEKYGVDPKKGAVAIVRPDQYVSLVTSLDDHDTIGQFFENFALQP